MQPPPDVSSYPTLPSDFFLIQEPEWSVSSNDLSIHGLTASSRLALAVNNLPANAGVERDMDSIPGSGRFPGGGAWQPTPVFLPGESPWTEESAGLQSIGSQRVGQD